MTREEFDKLTFKMTGQLSMERCYKTSYVCRQHGDINLLVEVERDTYGMATDKAEKFLSIFGSSKFYKVPDDLDEFLEDYTLKLKKL